MRSICRRIEDPEIVYPDWMVARHGRRCMVRLSIAGRELIVLAALLVVGGTIMGILQDDLSFWPSDHTSLPGHDGIVGSVCYSTDGRTLVSGGWDRQVKFWNVDEEHPAWGTEIQTLPHAWEVFSVAMTQDGRYLAAGGAGGFTIWARKSGSEWQSVKELSGPGYRSLAISPDGQTLAMTCCNRTIRLWDLATMAELRGLGGFKHDLRQVDFSSDGATLAVLTFGGDLQVWDLTTKTLRPLKVGIPGAVQSFTFLPGTSSLAIAHSGRERKELSIWDLDSTTPRARISDNQAGNNALAVSPDGRVLAAADQDHTIRLWDLATCQFKGEFHDGVGWVRKVAFSPNGRRIAFTGQSGIVQCRDLYPDDDRPKARHT